MSESKLPVTSQNAELVSFAQAKHAEEIFPTRDKNNNKIEVTDLFTYFTASIIRENTTFTR